MLHKCDTPSCVNPEHLYLGSNDDNVADKVSKGRSLSRAKNPAAKLTEEQVSNIRLDDRTQRVIAKDYKVSQATIHAIKAGKSW